MMADSFVVQKHWRATFERIEKFISPLYFTDVNLFGRYVVTVYCLFSYWFTVYREFPCCWIDDLIASVIGYVLVCSFLFMHFHGSYIVALILLLVSIVWPGVWSIYSLA